MGVLDTCSSRTRFEEGYKKIAERVGLPCWIEPQADILGLVSAWLFDKRVVLPL